MKKVKIIAGIIWAFVCLILILILFPGYNAFSLSVSKLPFMKINPRYNGGAIAKTYVVDACTLEVRKPVFDGFFKERKKGFVQIDWRGSIPETMKDSIDYDGDGKNDFLITVNRKDSRTTLNSFNTKVRNVAISTPTSYGWAVRVGLDK